MQSEEEPNAAEHNLFPHFIANSLAIAVTKHENRVRKDCHIRADKPALLIGIEVVIRRNKGSKLAEVAIPCLNAKGARLIGLRSLIGKLNIIRLALRAAVQHIGSSGIRRLTFGILRISAGETEIAELIAETDRPNVCALIAIGIRLIFLIPEMMIANTGVKLVLAVSELSSHIR